MKKETIKEYTVLYQYLLLLKKPTYIFLIQVLQHISPATWWEDFIQPVLQRENKENFKYLDFSDLLNVFKANWEKIFSYLDKNYRKYKYDEEYKLVNKVHQIRTIVAHANEVDMSSRIFVNSLSHLLDFAKLVKAEEQLVYKLEMDWMKYQQNLPAESGRPSKEGQFKEAILSVIENKVLLKAISCETLPPDMKLSIDRTLLRLKSMRTLDEIIGFFNGAIRSDRGMTVQQSLSKNGLFGFADIQEEINAIYDKSQGKPKN
ncbi:MAG: Swt1 family HEPN domain-containing protein [Spirochaetes bacterium]|nr:Swt1 family HEPN domain-containing protein [Spirochaetota bacterium]